jgi:hypothetical protein
MGIDNIKKNKECERERGKRYEKRKGSVNCIKYFL